MGSERLDTVNAPASTSRRWRVRPATVADVETLVAMRRGMFEDMGMRDEPALSAMCAASAAYFARALPAGEFRAWIADVDGTPVANGGLVIHAAPPTPANLAGREGYIMNFYTQPAWRGQGIATAILDTILEYLRVEGIPQASLHATEAGRPIYERAGFRTSNEMRRRNPVAPL